MASLGPTFGRGAMTNHWIDLQNATLSTRYRFADTSAGTITTNQLQHRESLRARFKFDAPGRYALNVGVFSGSRFTSSWNNTGIGLGEWQAPLAVRALYFTAQPIAGIEAQYGSMYILKGNQRRSRRMTMTGTSSANGFPYDVHDSCSSTRCRRPLATSRAIREKSA